MNLRIRTLAVLTAAVLATSTYAQTTFPEIEPNSVKAEATSVVGMTAGDSITGVCTGSTATAGLTTAVTIDTFRVKTAALPLGIYSHRLTLSTSTTSGHTGSIRCLNQTGTAGTASTGGTPGTTDLPLQNSSTITVNPPPRSNQWYGFGKQEELYYRVTGVTLATAQYTATMSTSTVPFTVIAPVFEATSPITITTVGQTTINTQIHVYDSNLNAIPGFDNNDEGPVGPTTQSRLIRTFAPGTYYLAIGQSLTCWNLPAAPDEDLPTSALMDFPDILVASALNPTIGTDDRDFLIASCNGNLTVSNQVASPDSFSVQWFQFTTAVGAPPLVAPANDNCANAMAFNASGSHTTRLSTATNDGAASCDPGGAFSRDLWYTFNGGPTGGTLAVSTCGTTLDTCLTAFNTCGGAEIACNDDCGGAPCAGTASCLSGLVLAPNQVILVRLADKSLGGCGDVTITFNFAGNAPSNDSCATPLSLAGLGTFPITNDYATTGAEGQSEALCNFGGGTPIIKDVWFTWVATNSGTITVTNCDLLGVGSQDTKLAVYNGAGCPAGASIACESDSHVCSVGLATRLTFNAVCGNTYTFQFGMNPGAVLTYNGGLSVTGAGPVCSTPSVPECIGDTAAACPCSGPGGSLVPNPGAAGNGCANFTFAAGANLSSSGLAWDNAGDSLVLTCTNMPGPGLFVQANALGGPFVNFNDGILCAAVGIIRMGVVFPDAFGVASYPGGLTPNPIHIAGGPVLLGGSPTPETKHYQCWYRDITPGFCNTLGHNMSNGLAIVWVP